MMEVFTCGKNYKLIQMQSNVLLVCDEQIKQVENYNFMQSLSHGSVLHTSAIHRLYGVYFIDYKKARNVCKNKRKVHIGQHVLSTYCYYYQGEHR